VGLRDSVHSREPQRLAFDAVWDVPTPFHNGFLKNTLGGWRASSTMILQSGLPFTVYTSANYPSGDYNADGYNFDVPNAPAYGNFVQASRSQFLTGVVLKSDFPTPAKGTEGNLGRNTFEGPGLANVNLNGIKTFHIPWFVGHEGATAEIRAEIFNLFNRVNLSNPTSDLSSGLFGESTGQAQARKAQFGIRIAF
jgi:hypothetical protein